MFSDKSMWKNWFYLMVQQSIKEILNNVKRIQKSDDGKDNTDTVTKEKDAVIFAVKWGVEN